MTGDEGSFPGQGSVQAKGTPVLLRNTSFPRKTPPGYATPRGGGGGGSHRVDEGEGDGQGTACAKYQKQKRSNPRGSPPP